MSLRSAPPHAPEMRHTLVEARMLAFLGMSCAAGRQVTADELALIPGAGGQPIGLKTALQTARDLMDAGVVVLPGLITSGRSQEVPVFTAGHQRPVSRAVKADNPEAVKVAPQSPQLPTPTKAPASGEVPAVAKVLGLPVPAGLPQPLRGELLAIAEGFADGGPKNARAAFALHERRIAAVEQWATLGGVPQVVLDKARTTWERYQAAQTRVTGRAGASAETPGV